MFNNGQMNKQTNKQTNGWTTLTLELLCDLKTIKNWPIDTALFSWSTLDKRLQINFTLISNQKGICQSASAIEVVGGLTE